MLSFYTDQVLKHVDPVCRDEFITHPEVLRKQFDDFDIKPATAPGDEVGIGRAKVP